MASNIGNFRRFDETTSSVWTISIIEREVRKVKYEEAIDLAGNGRYNYGLFAAASLALFSMCLDMFGFSVIVSGSACDFNPNSKQQNIMLSMPFIGAMIMSYPWGYMSDIQGRRKSLLIAMWGSFAAAIIGAFSPNWIVMAALKLFSCSFCSCAQSATYALVGESCPARVRGIYILIMTSVLVVPFPIYMGLYHIFQYKDFSYDLIFITFTPWRLLAVVLAFPLGISAFCLHFFYESPKFLLNAGYGMQSLDVLQKIWARNRSDCLKFPVDQLMSEGESTGNHGNVPFLRSLWNQTAPLFRRPLLLRTLQLYYVTLVIYSSMNSLYIKFPFLTNAFFEGASSGNQIEGLCEMIVSAHNSSNVDNYNPCTSKTDIKIVWLNLVQTIAFVTIIFMVSGIAHRKKTVLITVLALAGTSSVAAATVPNNMASLVLFNGIFLTVLVNGFLFSYFIDLYPTSHRGMATCLAVMVARAGGFSGINIVGSYIMTHCTITFHVIGATIFSAIVVSLFLPPDGVPRT